MIIYSSYKSGSQTIFQKHIIRDDGSEAYSRSARFPFIHFNKDGFEYIVPYNDDMVPIHEAFVFLNYDMADRPITSRTQAATAIRILYCYLSLANIDIHNIDADFLNGLIRFILMITECDTIPHLRICSQLSLEEMQSKNPRQKNKMI